MTFLKIATDAIARGLHVIPLSPGLKKPFLPDWQKLATRDLEIVKAWAMLYPTANCGAFCSVEADNFILDIDDFNWFFEKWPSEELPHTFAVKTGSGGIQFHFRHSVASKTLRNRSLKNPAFVEGQENVGVKAAFLDLLIDNHQGVLPGSTHPNGKLYEVLQDLPRAEITKEHLDWLNELWSGKAAKPSVVRLNPLCPGIDIEAQLKAANLKFTTHIEGTKTFFNYHAAMGKCLVRGASHAQPGERVNERQCAFVHDRMTNELYHYCFSAGCSETPGKTRIALEALDLKLEDLVIPQWMASFRGPQDLDQTDLEFVVEGMIPTETTTAIAGLAGHGKSWIALSIAKALIKGPGKLWNHFEIKKKYSVLYLTPEVGDKSLRKRLRSLHMDKFLITDFMTRTFSQGPMLPLDHADVIAAAKDRVVFLDTTVCFIRGDENTAADNKNGLRKMVLELLAAGAIAVIILHHAPKQFETQDYMTLETALRGSGDIGAMIGACYGIKFIVRDTSGRSPIQVECLKPRDFDGPDPFQLVLRDHIDKTGDLKLLKKPGECKSLSHEQKDSKPKDRKQIRDELLIKNTNEGLTPTQIAALPEIDIDRSGVSRRITALRLSDPTAFNTKQMELENVPDVPDVDVPDFTETPF
jgi:hypothetical protein